MISNLLQFVCFNILTMEKVDFRFIPSLIIKKEQDVMPKSEIDIDFNKLLKKEIYNDVNPKQDTDCLVSVTEIDNDIFKHLKKEIYNDVNPLNAKVKLETQTGFCRNEKFETSSILKVCTDSDCVSTNISNKLTEDQFACCQEKFSCKKPENVLNQQHVKDIISSSNLGPRQSHLAVPASKDIISSSNPAPGQLHEAVFKEMNSGKKIFKCDTCNSVFDDISHIVTPKQSCDCDNTMPNKCKKCFTVAFCRRQYPGDKQYKCDLCTKGFASKSRIAVNIKTHIGEKSHKFNICSVTFASKSDRVKHTRKQTRRNTGEKPYKCDICSAAFGDRSNLNIHKRAHTGEKPYKCDICSAAFGNCSTLNKHKRRHAGEKPYKCDICSASFVTRSDLAVHKRAHTGEKPYKCDICSDAFVSRSNLNKHKRRHTGEKPYKCDICSAAFGCRYTLSVHKRAHTGEKPYKCNICSAAFVTSSKLNVHKKRHTGEKPYTCDI